MPSFITKDPNSIKLELSTTGDSSSQVQIDLKGATIISWVVDGTDVIFLSTKAQRDGPKAIRGGIPLVFPQFGKVESPNPASGLPQHGFARIVNWTLDKTKLIDSVDFVSATFTLSSEDLKAQNLELYNSWPFSFRLEYTVCLKAASLSTSMVVTSTKEGESLTVTPLLHTYFTVEDIEKAKVTGLEGVSFIDTVNHAPPAPQLETNDNLTISGEVDRVYLEVANTGKLGLTPAPTYHLEFDAINLADAVVWNPWVEKSQAMVDLNDDDYRKFICVELGQVQNPKIVTSGTEYTYGQTIRFVKH